MRLFVTSRPDGTWFLIRRGEPLRREACLEDGRSASVFFRPERYDAVVWDTRRRELRINAASRWQKELYRRLFGQHLCGDPERFPDDAREPMARVGQGAVYTRTTLGAPLRPDDPAERARLLSTWFEPYHAALTAGAAVQLERDGRCLVLDGHSFATVPLPSEPDQDPDRPDVCLGTDAFHTPPALGEALAARIQEAGFRVAVDRPFAGTLVPLRWYGTDPRVTSVMLEVRRGLYMDESTGEPLPAFDDVAARLEGAVGLALGF